MCRTLSIKSNCSLLFFELRQDLVVSQNFFGELLLAQDQLVLSYDVVVDELLNLDIAVAIFVAFAEKLVDDLAAVIFINAFLRQEHQHLVFVNISVSVKVYCSELVVKLSLFFLLVI